MDRPKPTRKTWGISTPVYKDNFFQIEKIQVFAGGYSSIHRHHHKANRFLVESGRLVVRTFGGESSKGKYTPRSIRDLKCAHEHDLKRGMELTIPPWEIHSFHAAERTTGLEIYHLPPGAEGPINPEDIERFTTNGVDIAPTDRDDWEAARICAGCWQYLEIKDGMVMQRMRESNGAMRPFCNQCITEFQL